MALAFNLAIIIVGTVLTALVVLQARTPGFSNRDSSSSYRTKRGAEKTLHQMTIVLAVIFLLLSLIASLPIFDF